jgi:hypothetical protein
VAERRNFKKKLFLDTVAEVEISKQISQYSKVENGGAIIDLCCHKTESELQKAEQPRSKFRETLARNATI